MNVTHITDTVLRNLLLTCCLLAFALLNQPVFADENVATLDAPKAQAASSVVHPEWCYQASIYEVNIRQYTPEGTINAFREHLPRLQDMGVGILWLMPIHPIGEVNRKKTLGSYYAVKDFRQVNPEFGTMQDFKALVDEAHERGMRVILDWVPNHTAWDNHLTVDHPDWYTKDEHGNFTPPVPEWDDVIDLDYDNKQLWRYMLDSLAFWVREAGVDGYRVDVAGMVPLEFWVQARQELNEIKPVFLLAEWDDPAAHKAAYDMTYAWSLNGVFHDIVEGKKIASDLWTHLQDEDSKYADEDIRMYFTSNHDENSWHGSAIERYGDAAEVFAVITLTLDGMPLVYSGQEAGNDRRLKFFSKDQITWREHPMADVYKTLINLRKANPALALGGRGGAVKRIDNHTFGNELFAFEREASGHKVIVLANLTDHERTIMYSEPDTDEPMVNVFTGKPIDPDEGLFLKLEPWGYRVFAR